MKNKKTIIAYLFFLALLALSFLFSLWKIKFGFPVEDEAFYLTVPQRILQGDALIQSEWHLSQLFSVLLVPFVYFYQLIVGNNDGIIYWSRLIFISFHALISIIIFANISKKNSITIAGVLAFFAFSPYYMMSGNYYTLGIDFLALSAILYIKVCEQFKAIANNELKEDDKQVRNYTCVIVNSVLSGIFFSASVLCCPYLAFIYIIYAMIILIKKDPSRKAFGYFSVGVLMSLVSFLAFILSRTSINEIKSTLPFIMQDPEHNAQAIFMQLLSNIKKILFFSPFTIPCIAAILLTPAFNLIYKKKRNLECFIIALMVAIIWQISLLSNVIDKYNNYINLPIIFIGFAAYVLSAKKSKYIFVYIAGLAYSFCLIISSNLNLNIFCSGLIVSCLASFILIGEFLEEIKFNFNRFIVGSIAICLCVVQLVLLYNAKLQMNFWDEKTPNLGTQIHSGPASGIITAKAKFDNYNDHMQELDELQLENNSKAIFISQKPILYLYNKNILNASFSAWQGLKFASSEEITGNFLNRLESYYSLNPNKFPDIVYIDNDLPLNEEEKAFITNFFQIHQE